MNVWTKAVATGMENKGEMWKTHCLDVSECERKEHGWFQNSGKIELGKWRLIQSSENTSFGYKYIGFTGWQRTKRKCMPHWFGWALEVVSQWRYLQIYKHIYNDTYNSRDPRGKIIWALCPNFETEPKFIQRRVNERWRK